MNKEMKDSGVEWLGQIPNSWSVQRLKNILIERKENNKPIKTEDILSLTKDRGVIPYSEKGAIGNKSKTDLTQYKLAYPGDIVLNSMNVIIGSVGLSKYFGAVSPVYYMLRPRFKKDFVEYYNLIFQTQVFQKSLIGYGNGIMEHRMRIPMNNLNDIKLPIPPSDQQQKIVTYLKNKTAEIDNIVEKTKQSIEELKAYKQSLITETVTKGLNPDVPMKDSGIEWIGKLPNHWKLTRLKNVYNLNKGLTITKANLQDEGIPVVSYGDIHSRYGFKFNPEINPVKCVDERYLEKYPLAKLERGNFVFADTSEDLEGSGNFTVFDSDVITLAGYHTIVLKPRLEVNYKFIAYLFDSQAYRQQIQQLMQGVKVNSISQRILKNTTIWFPSDEEQTEIVNFLNEKTNAINGLINKKEKTIKELESYKQSLIYEYVTGKKEVE